MSEGGRRGVAISLAALIVVLSLGTVSGHEQETYNVIIVADVSVRNCGGVARTLAVARRTMDASVRMT